MLFFGMLNWTYTCYDPAGPIKVEQFAEMAADVYLNGLRHADPASAAVEAQVNLASIK